jgi:putative pyruvate formate lyase activating enzyme
VNTTKKPDPGYLKLLATGELDKRVDSLKNIYSNCSLCPHSCGIDRNSEKSGICRSGNLPVIASFNVHYGEEPPISGTNGSGTIFFSGCTGRCLYCQNYPISQMGVGNEVSEDRLAEMMIELQNRDCHNINLVTPTHFSPSIAAAIRIAASKGLTLPIVYNTSGYERVEVLRLLSGIIDVYLPDAKYSSTKTAMEFSGFKNYCEYNRKALVEMYHQVGNLKTYRGIAYKGLLVRHLILPENLAGTPETFNFFSTMISSDIFVSLMAQYFPAYKALTIQSLNRKITFEEYEQAFQSYEDNGLHNGWIQDYTDILLR